MSESNDDLNDKPDSEVDDDSEDERDDDERDFDDEDDEDGEDGDDDDESAEAKSDDRGPRRRRPRGRRRPREEYTTDDERSLDALAFVTDLIDKMHMECEVQLTAPRDEEEAEIALEINGEDAGRVIGKKGQVLAAIQFLTNRVVNRPGLERRHILVDAEGYRRRRESSLASMARRLGKQAVTDGKIITFEPMNPRDRRVVHLALAKFEGVITKSDGEGDDRRVQIIPVRR